MANPKQPRPVPDFKLMFQLAERYSEASTLLEKNVDREKYGASGPGTLVDSFAIELYLKCQYVLDHGAAPPGGRDGHNFVSIFKSLKPNTQTTIREAFNRLIQRDPVLSRLPMINPDAPAGLTDFDTTLKVAADTFTDHRYLYEQRTRKDWFYADMLRRAIREATKLDVRLFGL